jgi:drug/metabolite transporter (DMT)-like permease
VMSTRTGLLSVGAVLAALYPVVTVLLARIITKERIRRQQMAGLGLALCAVGLLTI